MKKSIPKIRPGPPPNPPKSLLEASKTEPGGLQDGIFCCHPSQIYSWSALQSVTKRPTGFLLSSWGPLQPLLGCSWGVPDESWAVQNTVRSANMQARNCFLRILSTFFSMSLLASIFGVLNFATICTETLKISVSPRRERNFRKIDFFV